MECIINGKDICPHTELSGKLCSACKEPDKARLNVEYYNFFWVYLTCFKKLEFKEQNELTEKATKRHIEAKEYDPEFNKLSTKNKKIMILELLEELC